MWDFPDKLEDIIRKPEHYSKRLIHHRIRTDYVNELTPLQIVQDGLEETTQFLSQLMQLREVVQDDPELIALLDSHINKLQSLTNQIYDQLQPSLSEHFDWLVTQIRPLAISLIRDTPLWGELLHPLLVQFDRLSISRLNQTDTFALLESIDSLIDQVTQQIRWDAMFLPKKDYAQPLILQLLDTQDALERHLEELHTKTY